MNAERDARGVEYVEAAAAAFVNRDRKRLDAPNVNSAILRLDWLPNFGNNESDTHLADGTW